MPESKAPIVNTQQLSRRMPSISKQRMQGSAADRRLPGERQVKTAAGAVKEGSFRMSSEVMDSVVGRREESEDMTVMQEPGL
jgi:hypothetical protein